MRIPEWMNPLIWIARALFYWHPETASEEELATADVIIPFSFGLPYDGKSNKDIAFWTRVWGRLSDQRNRVPVVAQWEIYDLLSRARPEYNLALRIGPKEIGSYLDTFDVAKAAADYCLDRNWGRAIVIAHPDHLQLCKLALEKEGFEVLVPPGLNINISYDPDSEQIWTRSPHLFIPREALRRIVSALQGKT